MATPPVGKSGLYFITGALRALGVLGAGEVPNGTEGNDALDILQEMFDSWNADGFMVYTTDIVDFPINGAKHTYTLGAGGDFDVDRPATIDRLSIVILSNPLQPLEYVIPIYSTQDWQEHVPVKTVDSTLPLLAYDDGAFPLRSITFWPKSSDNLNARFYNWHRLVGFADLSTPYAFPPGYAECIRYNLAVRLAPEYATSISPELASLAMTSMARVKSSNADDVQLRSDLGHGLGMTGPRMRAELFGIPSI